LTFVLVANATNENETFKMNLKTTSKMRGHLYNCCHIEFNETDRQKPDQAVLYEPFNLNKIEGGVDFLDFNYYPAAAINETLTNWTIAYKGLKQFSSKFIFILFKIM
jgi:hypothetical protein